MTTILDAISAVVSLSPTGGSQWKGLCPFCAERNYAAFRVDPGKGFYKCFACGKAGDEATFAKEMAMRKGQGELW